MQSLFFHTWFEACSPNSDLGRAQKSQRTADLAILTLAVEFFFEIYQCLNNKNPID